VTPERWQQIRGVLEKALELEPEQWSTYLNQACLSDLSLRQEVESLLASSDNVRTNFLKSTPILGVTLPAGTKLGEYEVKSLLGSGGMGEVYRARDSRLKRDVAIKVLPSFLSADPERLRRFEQEARAAASLNHPNILALHQMGTYEGAPYMVSELLEGETLREQVKRGRFSVRKAIDYGVQIARGLAAAHEKRIVHRDLKPENLFITKDGRVKVLDFGLAKLTQPQSESKHDTPTPIDRTEPGVVMGTVGYMSPEQVRGQTVDHRTDIFAFGAILYEMLTGNRAFQRPTSADTTSAILNDDPPEISQLPTNIRAALQRLVHRCLEKNPEQRFQSASDLAFALDALSETSRSTAHSKEEAWHISKLWAFAAVLAGLVAVVLALRYRTQRNPERQHELVERQLTATPPESTVSSAAISRDGKYLAYGDVSNKLYLLAIDTGEVRQFPLPAPYQPLAWFPDGNHLLLSGADGDLWKVSILDSSLRKLWSSLVFPAAVSPDGSRIALVKDDHEILLMGADGEEPHKILATDAGESIGGIAWSPTGQRIAYLRYSGSAGKPEIAIETCDMTGGMRSVVISDPHLSGPDGTSGIAWLPNGGINYSIYSGSKESRLWSRIADPSTGKPRGDAKLLAGWKDFEARSPQASADGKRLIASRFHVENGIYVGDLTFEKKALSLRRFTADDWYNVVADWTNDSKAILFSSKRNGRWAIFKQNITAKLPETLIAGSENYFWPKLSAQGTLLYSATASPDRWEPGDTTIRLMSTPEAGGARSTLMMGRYDYACGTSPSTHCIVSELKNHNLTFSYLDPVKGLGQEITKIGGYQSIQSQWDLSPDGSRLAIVDGGVEKGEIRILNLVDRRVEVLPIRDWKWKFLSRITWTADGKSWFADAVSGSSVELFSIDASGNTRVLYAFPADAGYISSIAPSPDGKHLALTKRVFVNDVMLLENF
jgi:eukaryotic-like serine/threonine-protein kinase